MSDEAVIAGAFEVRYERHPGPQRTTEALIVEAVLGALADAGVDRSRVDGLGVASFSLAPDHAIDMAWRLGLRVRWLMEDTNGGASGLNLLAHAVRAIEAGDAEAIVLAAGDRLGASEFHALTDSYNRVTREQLAPLPLNGPNALFSFVTQRHARAHGLAHRDYGCVPIAQRHWAHRNPGAVYRDPLGWDEYLAAPAVAPPLSIYDCVPVVSGADAVVVTARDDGSPGVPTPCAGVRAIRSLHNPDDQEGDGTVSGFGEIADELWAAAGARPEDLDAAYLYDDYPVMVAVQADDCGLVAGGDLQRFLHERLLEDRWPLNTSGGQLSCGQAGAAAGLHGLVEAVTQLRGRAGPDRQIEALELALVTGYGMVVHTHGACHNAVVLERVLA